MTRYDEQGLENAGRTESGRCAAFTVLVFATIVLVFQPGGRDQFLLPKLVMLGVLTPLVAGLVLSTRRRGMLVHPAVSATVVLTLWSVFAPVTGAVNPALHWYYAIETAALPVFFFAGRAVREGDLRSERRLLGGISVTAALVATIALLQATPLDPVRLLLGLGSTRPGRWRILTTLGNPGWTAEFLVLCLPTVAVFSKIAERRWERVVSWGVLVLIPAAVAVTGSRLCIVLTAACFVAWIGYGPGLPRTKVWRSVAVVLLIGVGALELGGGLSRWEEYRPVTGRFALWASGVELLRETPLTGNGLGSTPLVLPVGLAKVVEKTSQEGYGSLPTLLVDRFDDDALQLAVERGIPTAVGYFALFAWGLITAVRRGREDRRPMDVGIAAGLAIFGVLSLFSAPFHTPATAVFFWLLLGLAFGGVEAGIRSTVSSGSPVPLLLGGTISLALALAIGFPVLRLNQRAGHAHRLLSQGREEEAAAILAPPAFRAPWLPGATIDRAEALLALDRPEEALAVLAEAEGWTSSERITAVRARALGSLGLEDLAERELDRGFAVLPRSPVLIEAWEAIVGEPEGP